MDGLSREMSAENGDIDRELAHRVAEQLTDALGYMHSKQIVHRDLKPANIMVTHNGRNVKLIDFSLSDSDVFDVLKLPAGTSGYIAPEQLLPGAKADTRADIYSFGKVLEQMAAKTGDRDMLDTAKVCTIRNADKRPASMAQITTLRKRHTITLRIAAIFLSIVSATLAIHIAVTLYHRINDNELPGGQNGINISDGGNKAVDYRLWPDTSSDE